VLEDLSAFCAEARAARGRRNDRNVVPDSGFGGIVEVLPRTLRAHAVGEFGVGAVLDIALDRFPGGLNLVIAARDPDLLAAGADRSSPSSLRMWLFDSCRSRTPPQEQVAEDKMKPRPKPKKTRWRM